MANQNYGLPDHLVESLRNYADHFIPLGGFLTACVENDLMQAVARADNDNIRRIPEIVKYIYNKMPMGCHGSPANVEEWLMRSTDVYVPA